MPKAKFFGTTNVDVLNLLTFSTKKEKKKRLATVAFFFSFFEKELAIVASSLVYLFRGKTVSVE